MSEATYRGIKYDPLSQKESHLSWWNKIHCDATRWFVYRGQKYRAYDQCKTPNLR